MKRLDKKKLQLGRETLRALGSDELVHANGGLTFLCGLRTGYTCDVPSVTCSVVGYENTCGSSGIIG